MHPPCASEPAIAIPAYRHRALHGLNIGLLHKYLLRLGAQGLHLRFCQRLALQQLVYLCIDFLVLVQGRGCHPAPWPQGPLPGMELGGRTAVDRLLTRASGTFLRLSQNANEGKAAPMWEMRGETCGRGGRYSFGWVQATGPGPARECGTCAEFGRGPPMSTARTKEAPHTASAPSEAWRLIVTANLLARWCCILHPSPGPACVGHPRRVIACPRRPVPSLPAHGRSSIQGSVHEHPGPHIPAWRRPMGARMAVLRSRAGRRSGLRGSRACSAGRGASSPQTGRIGGVRVGTHAREPMCLRCLQASCVPPGREPPAGLPFARERPLCSARLPIPKTHARARARTCIPETCFESGPGAGRRAATAAPPSPATRGWSLRRARACAW